MAHGERKCYVDGKDYVYCPRCNKGDPNETWRYMYCSDNCRDIMEIIPKFNGGFYTKEQAKEDFEKLDLSGIDGFNESIKNQILDIITEPAPVPTKKNKKKDVNEIVEEIIPSVEEL